MRKTMTHRMGQALAALALGLLGSAAQADATDFVRLTQDNQNFSEVVALVGWRGAGGVGLRTGVAEYRAPGWRASGRLLQATQEWRDDAHELDLSLGVADLAGFTHTTGHLDYLRRVLPGTRLGASLERQYVASRRSIEAGVTFDHAAAVLEHSFTPQLELGASLGQGTFSNDNMRTQLRTRWTYELAPDAGRYVYLKTRDYQNSNPGRPEYFSPRRLAERSLGLAHKARLSPAVVGSAEGDYGRQDTESASRPLWGLTLALSSPRRQALQWRVALQWTNAAASASAGDHYRNTSLTGQIQLPL